MTVERKCIVCGNNISTMFDSSDNCKVCGYDNSMQQKTCYLMSVTAENGSVSGVSDGDKYYHNKVLVIEATPEGGYVFSKWTINGVDYTENPKTLVIREAKTIVAVFVPE